MESSQAKGLIKGLETWAKKVTSDYRDVNVRDMSSSFRDGLAFCAIIHHYRPDLIDFESLSKENILQNNSLAFSTAEKQLGVPALLDAEDMVKYSRPDRLSIITYLSQLHNCFVNQNKVKTLKPGVRIRPSSIEGPPPKIPTIGPNLLTPKRHEVCHSCNHRVFILERLIVDGKLYHTTCFRCNKCNSLLNPGAYVESDTAGLYECAICLPDESSSNMETQDSESSNSGDKFNSLKDTPTRTPSPLTQRNAPNKSPLTESVTHARNSFLQNSLSSKPSEVKSPVSEKDGSPSFLRKSSPSVLKRDSPSFLRKDSPSFLRKDSPSFQRNDSPASFRNSMSSIEGIESSAMKNESVDGAVSVKDKISAFESNRNSRTESIFKSQELASSTKNSAIHSNDNETFLLNKSKTGATVSPISPSMDDSTDKPVKSLSPFSASIANASDLKSLPKSVLSSSTQSLKSPESTASDTSMQNDTQNCDSPTPVLLRNKVPSAAHLRHSLQFQTLSNDTDKSKEPTRPFQTGEYKSPLKTSRDIFQTNIQPLKLSIPTISSNSKRDAILLSSDSSKPKEVSQIRPDFAKTLPRQTSVGSLLGKEKSNDSFLDSSNSLTEASSLKWNQTIPRRSSFESQNQHASLTNVKLTHSTQKEESKSLTDMNLENALSILNAGSSVSETNRESNARNAVSPSGSRLSEIPIPKVRRSLEIKRNLNNSAITGVGIPSKLSDSSLNQVAPVKPVVSEVRLDSDQVAADVTPIKVSKREDSKDKLDEKAPEVVYPDDLNPFGDDEEEEEKEEYPDDLNPFGDDEEVAPPSSSKTVVADDYDESKNPFASDDDDADTSTPIKTTPVSSKPVTPASSPFPKANSKYTSPTGSLRGTMKKRVAPKPPRMSDIFPPQTQDSEGDVSLGSIKSSPSVDRKSIHTPSPKVRRNKPAAPPPPIPTGRQTSQTDLAASAKQMKEADNMKIKSTSGDVKDAPKAAPKKKKRPAPPVPIPKRLDNKKIPLKDILKEMKEIEEKQRECERQGRDLELLIRDKDKDEEPSIEEEEYIMQLFELVNQKNALFRRQAELMYIKRSQRLEEQQADLQNQIRELLMKPAEEKTEDDKAKEEMLILELKDIVDQRSSIIDSIEMDRRRELEEDASVQEQLEMKNGDLPITAEIKEKSSGKDKKSKAKKEKKEKKEKKSKKK